MSEGPTIEAAALQFPVTMDIARNVAVIEALIDPLPQGAVIVAPEGALSGYLPEPDFVARIDQAHTRRALDRMAVLCNARRVHLIAGACIEERGVWRNSSFYFGPNSASARYDKINLASSERGTFAPGNTLPAFSIDILGCSVRIGIQMCREIRYPEQWRVLAQQGAQIIAYVNNAIGSSKGDSLWRAHVISRAAETQRFVVGANNAAADQTCPTIIAAPTGDVLADLPANAEAAARATLSLDLGA